MARLSDVNYSLHSRNVDIDTFLAITFTAWQLGIVHFFSLLCFTLVNYCR